MQLKNILKTLETVLIKEQVKSVSAKVCDDKGEILNIKLDKDNIYLQAADPAAQGVEWDRLEQENLLLSIQKI